MSCYNEDVKLDEFREKTTYLNDYKRYCNVNRDSSKAQRIRQEPISPPPQKFHYENHETFAKLKNDAYVKFNLLMYPKPIIQTDPRKPFQKLVCFKY